MFGFGKNKNKPYAALSAEQQQAHLTDLEEQYGDDWNEKVQQFYLSLFKAMGEDFTTPPIDDDYKRRFIRLTKDLKYLGEATHEGEVFQVYDTQHGGHLYVNHNHIKHEGDGFNATIGYEMGFLAIHDKDMIKRGVTLEGSAYEQSILQLSIQYHNPHIKIHNKLKNIDPNALIAWNQHLNKLRQTYNDKEAAKDTVNPNIVTDGVYKQVKRQVKRQGVATKKHLISFLKNAGFTGSENQGYRQVADRLDAEGITTLNQAKNRRTAVQRDFYRAAHEITSDTIKMAQNAVAKSISLLKKTIKKMPAVLSHASTVTKTAFTNTVHNLKNKAELIKVRSISQPNPSPT